MSWFIINCRFILTPLCLINNNSDLKFCWISHSRHPSITSNDRHLNIHFFHVHLRLDVSPDMRPLNISLNTAHSGCKSPNWHQEKCSRMCSSIDRSYIGLTSSVKSWRHVRRHALILHIWITFCWIAWPQKLWNLHKARCSRISGSGDRCIASLTSCMTTWLYVIALTLVVQFSNVSHKIEVNCCFEKFFKLCIAKAS